MREALPALIRRALAEPRDDALIERVNDAWAPTSSAQLLTRVESVACAIRDAGLVAGDRVALIAHNCVDWIVCDFATFFAGCVVVPIYPTQALDHTAYILEHSGARLLFVDSQATLERLRRRIRRFRARSDSIPPATTASRTSNGTVPRSGRHVPELPEAYEATLLPDDLAVLIYTSGTTGTTQGRHAFARQPKL